ncbi:hypothetical protein NP493_846g00023 [Ridgeia piscesae]|uniref:Reverse transcriptase domain-containing protein n=1 Tax=Ridgeia piscesae TaxID=27915 RepID=A0AAD9NKQ5_RIDPI|nr:hypothetical protein NP493_846g00023 [Ridgeia piscesae]
MQFYEHCGKFYLEQHPAKKNQRGVRNQREAASGQLRFQYGVEKAIREAKTDYRRKLEGQFLSNYTRSVWQRLQCIADYTQKHSIPGFDSATPDNFNNFYARFERHNLTPTSVSLPNPAVPLFPLFTVQEHEHGSTVVRLQENRCTDDAGALALRFVMQQLESPNRYARILFVDYSSTFNTVIPQKMFDKLQLLSLDLSMCYWLLDFYYSDHR